jgi:membrane protein implicated in regulation of membrane protease activity
MAKFDAQDIADRKGKFGFIFMLIGFALLFASDFGVPVGFSMAFGGIFIVLGLTALIASRVEG